MKSILLLIHIGNNLQAYNDGFINLHCIFVYYWTVKDPDFEDLTKEEKNIFEYNKWENN